MVSQLNIIFCSPANYFFCRSCSKLWVTITGRPNKAIFLAKSLAGNISDVLCNTEIMVIPSVFGYPILSFQSQG